MGNFQPSIGGRVNPSKPVVPKVKDTNTHSPPQNDDELLRNESTRNISIRTWPVWVWVTISAFIGLYCLLLYYFYVTEERLQYGSALASHVMHTVEIRHWSWWYWPVFWGLVVLTIVRFLLFQRMKSPEAQYGNAQQLNRLLRLLPIVIVGLMVVLLCAHSDVLGLLRILMDRMRTIEFPWWAPSLAITLVIALLGVIWMIQRYQEENDVEEWSLRTKLGLIFGGIATNFIIHCGSPEAGA